MKYYTLWKNRNGMKMWDGPYAHEGVAHGYLSMVIDARENGSGFILPEGGRVNNDNSHEITMEDGRVIGLRRISQAAGGVAFWKATSVSDGITGYGRTTSDAVAALYNKYSRGA